MSSSPSPSPPSKAKRPGGCILGPRPQPLILAAAEASRPSKKPRVAAAAGDMGPVIVYELTPRVVHARPEEFSAIVQKLTGKQPTAMATAAPVPSDSTVTLPDLVAGETDAATAAATAADPLVLALGQQRQPVPPAIDDDDDDHSAHPLPPPSPAASFLLSPSSLFFSPTTMQALQELGVLF